MSFSNPLFKRFLQSILLIAIAFRHHSSTAWLMTDPKHDRSLYFNGAKLRQARPTLIPENLGPFPEKK